MRREFLAKGAKIAKTERKEETLPSLAFSLGGLGAFCEKSVPFRDRDGADQDRGTLVLSSEFGAAIIAFFGKTVR